jgi:hypothetical protein
MCAMSRFGFASSPTCRSRARTSRGLPRPDHGRRLRDGNGHPSRANILQQAGSDGRAGQRLPQQVLQLLK